MSSTKEALRPSLSFWASVPIAAAVTWSVHELAHFQAGRWLGYDMWLSLNKVGLVSGAYASREHELLVTMAGPLVTYAQAALALWLVRSRRWALAYPYLFLAFFMRLMAFVVSFSNPNDEARASLELGWPVWALPTIAVCLLLALTVVGSRSLRVGWRCNALLYLAASLFATAIVFGSPLLGPIL